MNKEEFEYFKSECDNAQFKYEEFRVSDIKCLIEKVEQLEKENADLKMQLSNCKLDLANARY